MDVAKQTVYQKNKVGEREVWRLREIESEKKKSKSEGDKWPIDRRQLRRSDRQANRDGFTTIDEISRKKLQKYSDMYRVTQKSRLKFIFL